MELNFYTCGLYTVSPFRSQSPLWLSQISLILSLFKGLSLGSFHSQHLKKNNNVNTSHLYDTLQFIRFFTTHALGFLQSTPEDKQHLQFPSPAEVQGDMVTGNAPQVELEVNPRALTANSLCPADPCYSASCPPCPLFSFSLFIALPDLPFSQPSCRQNLL